MLTSRFRRNILLNSLLLVLGAGLFAILYLCAKAAVGFAS